MIGPVDLPLDTPELTFEAAGGSLVRRSLLRSGIRVLTERVPGARSASIGFWVPVGSRDEGVAGPDSPAAAFGSTHFLEHLLFKGTPTRSALDIATAFDGVGGEHNAVTAKEYTCYYAKVRDEDVPLAVRTMADMVTNSVLDPAEFELERGVIIDEIARGNDDAHAVCAEALFRGMFGDHPLGRPVGGTVADIEAVSRDSVYAHYQARYCPSNLVVTVAGAVDHDALVTLIEDALAQSAWRDAPDASPQPRRAGPTGPLPGLGGLSIVQRPLEQGHVMLALPGIAVGDERRVALSVLNSILGGGMSSRLFQEIRERRGLAYSVYSTTQSYSDAGVFLLAGSCAAARTREVGELMLAELARLGADGVDPAELERARGQISGGAALAFEDSDTRMSRLGSAEISLGQFLDLDESLARVAAVTADDVVSLAGELVGGAVTVSAVGTIDEDDFLAAGLAGKR